jgi:glycosyltransferase involved in cell wall biosynthesis
MPQVSVIIPAYNQARYLGLAIQSVLDQTYADFEVVVVDDGSTDATAQVAQGFSDRRVRYVFQSNRGLSAARNTGLRNSSGRLVTFLDSDDEFLPDKLSWLAALFDQQPDLGLAAGQAVLIDEAGQPTGQPFASRLATDPAQLVLGNPLHVGSVLLRRDWQEKVGYFDERLRSYEDWDMWLRLALAGCPMTCLERPVSRYRFHTAQMTRDGGQMTTATFAVLDKVFATADLPLAWSRWRDEAYSRAHLRAAAQSYLAGRYAQAQTHLREAARLHPALLADHGRPLAQHFSAWIELPKTGDPVEFIENIYRNLPAEFDDLRRHRRNEVAQVALDVAFRAYRQGNLAQARAAFWRAVRSQPGCLTNRGNLSLLLHLHHAGNPRRIGPEHGISS